MSKSLLLSRLFISILLIFLMSSHNYGQINKETVEKMIDEARELWQVPGIGVGIYHNGKVFSSRGYEHLASEHLQKVDEHTLFAIASNTKAFMATAISILVEQGKLSWHDPVQKYVPEFALADPYISSMVTIEDLLCHRVGLGTYSGDVLWYKSDYQPRDLMPKLKHLPLVYPFRDGYGYTNLMFIAAGEVVNRVTGLEWNVFVEEKIFKPLKMGRTITSTNALGTKGNFATPHKPDGKKNQPIDWVNWDNMGAAGGIISSVDDMLKWCALQLNQGINGKDTLFSRSSQIKWWTPHNSFPVSDQSKKLFAGRNYSGYGLGWSLSDYDGRMIASHGGGYDGMYSRLVIVPEENLAMVILTNTMKGISTYLSYAILDKFLGRSEKDWTADGLKNQMENDKRRKDQISKRNEKRDLETLPDFEFTACTGLYRCKMYGDIQVAQDEGVKKISFIHAPDLNAILSHWHHNTFQLNWEKIHAWFGFGTVQFVVNNNGDITGLQFDVPNEDIFFEEIHAEKVR